VAFAAERRVISIPKYYGDLGGHETVENKHKALLSARERR
jgi:hypothetical protein